VARRLGAIAKAKPKLPSGPIGARLWRVFSEVFLQTRVIRERPVAGLLHGLVMWGFFVFAWVSAEHFLQAFQGLDNATRDESWYGLFAGIWALAVLAGMAGLSFRRFILRPASLGQVSLSSGLVALLIAGLMISYLAGWRGLDAASWPWRINWWFHTACFLGMLFAIPNSKHLHLVLAPVAIFFRSGTTSATRSLREGDDEDFGMLAFEHLSQKDILDLNACVECGRCTDYCPANLTGGSLDPKAVILQMQQGWLRGGETVAGTPEEVRDGKAWVSEWPVANRARLRACDR
jgi:ferredoxin